MYLVEDERHGSTHLVFTWEDPRRDSFRGKVLEGVTLDYDIVAVHQWASGEAAPDVSVGKAKTNPQHYRVFRSRRELEAAGFEFVPGTPEVFSTWSEYVQYWLTPLDPAKLNDEQWYRYLDKLDEEIRTKRHLVEELPGPTNGDRDEVAAWLARKHINFDNSIREVWYLPQDAPPDEIRLLEVSDRLPGDESSIQPIDFGLDVEGAAFRLLVADVTTAQLSRLETDPSRLPPGWRLENARNWRRGA